MRARHLPGCGPPLRLDRIVEHKPREGDGIPHHLQGVQLVTEEESAGHDEQRVGGHADDLERERRQLLDDDGLRRVHDESQHCRERVRRRAPRHLGQRVLALHHLGLQDKHADDEADGARRREVHERLNGMPSGGGEQELRQDQPQCVRHLGDQHQENARPGERELAVGSESCASRQEQQRDDQSSAQRLELEEYHNTHRHHRRRRFEHLHERHRDVEVGAVAAVKHQAHRGAHGHKTSSKV
mmetsp:Transcript_40601/g.100966  ORF Transcript_40601/g.100966 Transcript_40601/m.100966 type:complete len:242 (-) Transcript_40601:188-913(-)